MRTAPTKIALLAVAIATLALLAVVAWQSSAGATNGDVVAAAPDAPEPITLREAEPETLILPPGPRAPAANVTSLEPGTQRVEVSDDPFDRAHFATVILLGRIESSRKDLALAQVEVRPTWEGSGINEKRGTFRHLTVPARNDGTFELDVTELIQGRKRERIAIELAVAVTHPMLASAKSTVHVPGEDRLQRERRIEISTVVRMPWGIATLAGQVRTVDGAAAAIKVAAFKNYNRKTLANVEEMVTAAVENGAFRLDVHAGVPYTIVVFAEGYRPATLRASADAGGAITLPMVVLTRGEMVRGRVSAGSTTSTTSTAGATVAAEPAEPYTRVVVDGAALAWCGDGFEWAGRAAAVSDGGDYAIDQLGPRAYRLSVNGLRGSYFARAPTIDVVAPSAGADIALGDACEVHLAFFQDGRPAVVHFAVHQERGKQGRSFAAQNSGTDGLATLFVDSGTPTNIVFMDHAGERTLAIPACNGGVVDIRVDL